VSVYSVTKQEIMRTNGIFYSGHAWQMQKSLPLHAVFNRWSCV